MENPNENNPINDTPNTSDTPAQPPQFSDGSMPMQEPAQPDPLSPSPSEGDRMVASVPPQPVAAEANKPKKWIMPAVLIALVIVVLVGGAIAAFALLGDNDNKKENNTATTTTGCTDTSAPLNDDSAKSAYKQFVAALKSDDQSCANTLSTDVFQTVRSQTYAAPKGEWLSKSGDNSGIGDFKKLPDTLEAEKLSTAEYIRADYSGYEGLENAGQPEGLTVKYTMKSDKGYDLHLNLSFVAENDKLLVDDLAVIPASLDDDDDF